MKATLTRLTFALALAALTSGCLSLERKSTVTAPSDAQGLAALLGSWTSSPVLPSAGLFAPTRLIFPEGALTVPAFTTFGPIRKTEPPLPVSMVP